MRAVVKRAVPGAVKTRLGKKIAKSRFVRAAEEEVRGKQKKSEKKETNWAQRGTTRS